MLSRSRIIISERVTKMDFEPLRPDFEPFRCCDCCRGTYNIEEDEWECAAGAVDEEECQAYYADGDQS